MKKINKKNKRKRKIYFFLIIIFYLSSFCLTIKLCFKKYNHDIVEYLVNNNSSYIEKKNNKKVITKIVSLVANIDFKNPVTMISNNYDIDDNKVNEEEKEEKLKDNYVPDPKPDIRIEEPIVYLYNTHQTEEYALSNNEEYNVKPTVMTLSYILREKLNNKGIKTIVEENNVSEFLKANNWNYASSYKVTRLLLDDIKSKNKSLKYYIDLHRDSVSKNISTININNISYAKILFIVGLENPNYKINLEKIEKLNNIFNERYPGLSRGIYKKKGKGVNGVYNQDFDPNTILIEVGGEDNTIDEVYNTAEAISSVLADYIRSDNSE